MGGRKKYITERNGRSSWEWQGIVAFCTCQWKEWILSIWWILTSLKKCTLVKHTLILENSNYRAGYAALFTKQCIHETEKFTLLNCNLQGNFLFVFVTFLAVAKLPNTCKMLQIKVPYVAVARGWKPPGHDSSWPSSKGTTILTIWYLFAYTACL